MTITPIVFSSMNLIASFGSMINPLSALTGTSLISTSKYLQTNQLAFSNLMNEGGIKQSLALIKISWPAKNLPREFLQCYLCIGPKDDVGVEVVFSCRFSRFLPAFFHGHSTQPDGFGGASCGTINALPFPRGPPE